MRRQRPHRSNRSGLLERHSAVGKQIAVDRSGELMEPWQILGAGIGVGIVVSQLWRRQAERHAPDRTTVEDPTPTEPGTDAWVELDVEPLFPSSEPVSRDYLLDLTDPIDTDSDRPI